MPVVIVTGASSGIGAETARLFAANGYSVVVAGGANKEGVDGVVTEITSSGGKAVGFVGDLSDPATVKDLFTLAIDTYGSVDVLINNAGRAPRKDFMELTKEDWVRDLHNNLLPTVLCSQEYARVTKKGAILNTGSVRGIDHTGKPTGMPYAAAKAGVHNFTRTLAKRLAPDFTVNCVAPGFVKAGGPEKRTPEEEQAKMEQNLLHRRIQPREIAEAFLYLATAKAVTGHIHVVDAGFTLKQEEEF